MELILKAALISAMVLGGVGVGWGLKTMSLSSAAPAAPTTSEQAEGQYPADQAQAGQQPGQPQPGQPGAYDRPYESRPYYRPYYSRHSDNRYYR